MSTFIFFYSFFLCNRNIQYNCIFPGTVSSLSICPNAFSFMLIVGTIYGEIYECRINNELV